MEKFEKEFKDFLEGIRPEERGLKEKVIRKINKERKKEHVRKIVSLTLIVAIISMFALSFVAPVFGKAGTLPQLVKSVRIESAAKNFEGIIEVDESVLQKITESNLPFADAVVISALSKDKSIDIDKVIEMRKDGFGWGIILDSLNSTLSERDILSARITPQTIQTVNKNSKDISQSTNTNNTNSSVSSTQNETEQNANQNKNANQGQGTSVQNQERETEQEQNDNELIIVVKGTISSISTNIITISGESVIINENTTIKYLGKEVALSQLKEGDSILVHAVKDGDTLVARDIIVYKSTPGKQNQATQENKNKEENQEQNKSESSQNQEQNKEQNSQKEYELNTVITGISNSTLTLKDFANPVILDSSTKIEQNGVGRVDASALKEGLTVQIHIRFDGTTYKATQIIIQEKPESKDKSKGNSENTQVNKGDENSSKGKKP